VLVEPLAKALGWQLGETEAVETLPGDENGRQPFLVPESTKPIGRLRVVPGEASLYHATEGPHWRYVPVRSLIRILEREGLTWVFCLMRSRSRSFAGVMDSSLRIRNSIRMPLAAWLLRHWSKAACRRFLAISGRSAPGGDRRRYATGVQIKKASARDHKIFLSKRLREFSKGQPELLELRRILLKLGGEELIPPPDHDPVTNFLIDFGIVFAGPIVLKQSGRQRGGALGRIWIRRLYGIVGIGIGYALEEDGLWREHTFGVLREGILETIAPKRKYFGLLLISEAADRLAETLNK
jgi:hypothetical protein